MTALTAQTKLTCALIAAFCDVTDERSPCTDQVPPKSTKRGKLVSAKAIYSMYHKIIFPEFLLLFSHFLFKPLKFDYDDLRNQI